jgi:hypothetical protein
MSRLLTLKDSEDLILIRVRLKLLVKAAADYEITKRKGSSLLTTSLRTTLIFLLSFDITSLACPTGRSVQTIALQGPYSQPGSESLPIRPGRRRLKEDDNEGHVQPDAEDEKKDGGGNNVQ